MNIFVTLLGIVSFVYITGMPMLVKMFITLSMIGSVIYGLRLIRGAIRAYFVMFRKT